MGLNPHIDTGPDPRSWVDERIVALEGATVITAPTHTSGDDVGHEVEVAPDMVEEALTADVRVGQNGDVTIPVEGSRVLIGYRVNGRPIVIGQRYAQGDDVPDFEPGERVIGHPLSDSHVRLAADGTLHVEGDTDVVINGGSKGVIHDVTLSKDGDGHVTDVTLERRSDILI